MRKIVYSIFALALLTSTVGFTPVSAATSLEADTLIKTASSAAVYYYDADGKRYAFPNERVYDSWFTGFGDITVVTDEELAQIPLGGTVKYRPGVLLIKVPTDPKVYAVGENGALRWVQTEQIARALYGDEWSRLVDDLPIGFFAQYLLGLPIFSTNDFNPDDEIARTPTISHGHGHGKKLKRIKRGSDTNRCRVILSNPKVKVIKNGRGVSVTFARDCKKNQDNDNNQNATLALSGIVASVSTSTASINWYTNQDSSSAVTFNTNHLDTATTTSQTISSSSLVKFHSLLLTGLTPAKVYYYQVVSTNATGTTVTSSEKMFTTKTVSNVDTAVPVVTNATATPSITSAVVTWTTDEAATTIVQYADQSLSTATTSQTSSNSSLVTSHSRTLTGLSPNTTYFYVVKSADASGNLATTTETTFTTLPAADITPPVISSILAVPGNTTSTISWITNEAATSVVKYSPDPLATAVTILNVNSSSLVTNHSIDLTGLSASTTYYFMVESADVATNLATSTQQSFDTTL